MRIISEESVGLVIDIQKKLFPHISDNKELLDRTVILLSGLQQLSIPMLITEQYKRGLGETLDEIRNFFPGRTAIEKMAFSCCDEPEFMDEIKLSGRKNIILCGIETHVCVLQTSIDLLENGFQPVVVKDCVSSRRPADRETALERMRMEGVIITTVESILFELARVSGTETFKAISRLVK